MPIFISGSGGGGATGYAYPIGNVISPSVDTNGSAIALKWRDPDDATLSGGTVEWKGTIVVAKQGSPPIDADDGERVAEVTEKNSHAENALMTDVGGVGYYYGFFPYTKDYVVNNHRGNVLIADGGMLAYTPWADIAAASANGTASGKWAIGDEKKITLTGAYAGEYTFVIADFNHDDLSDGSGKAGITFASKDIVASVARGDTSPWYFGNNKLRNAILPSVKECLPDEVSSQLKKVNKLTNVFSSNGALQSNRYVTEDDLFIPAYCEINGFYSPSDMKGEGEAYPLYDSAGNLPGGGDEYREFYIRTRYPTSTSSWYVAYVNQSVTPSVNYSVRNGSAELAKESGLLIMFCV